jgi:hypothetical protein
MIKTTLLPCFGIALCVAASLALTSCSSTRATAQPLGETTRSTTYKEGVPGSVIVETTKIRATVTAIDTTNRTVTIAVKDGRQKTIHCGPEVINFDQIHISDRVSVTIKSELVLALAGAGTPPIDAGVAAAVLAPKGDKPGGVMTEMQEYTATVTAINQRRREVTFRLPDDSTRTFTVRPDLDLTQRKVGEKVAVRVSVAVAISVEKP